MKLKQFFIKHQTAIVSTLISLFSIAALATILLSFSFYLAGMISEEGPTFMVWLFAGLSLMCVGSISMLKAHRSNSDLTIKGRYIIGSLEFVTGVLTLVFMNNNLMFISAAAITFALAMVYRILWMIAAKQKRSLLKGAIYLLIELVLFVTCLLDFEDIFVALILLTVALFIVSLFSVIAESFAKIHFATLKDIVKKTFAVEILSGLIFLIVAFSLVFYILEGVPYLDALWYCFAVVTTIGFGDVVVKSVLARILSVILGLYGIVVVAVITSIIVNFYNESKYVGKKTKDNESEEPKEDQ